MFFRVPNIFGKDVGRQGAAWTAGKAILPMQSSAVSPKMLRTWFMVTALQAHMQCEEPTLQWVPGAVCSHMQRLLLLTTSSGLNTFLPQSAEPWTRLIRDSIMQHRDQKSQGRLHSAAATQCQNAYGKQVSSGRLQTAAGV